jgi:signal transduction histidine kinase
MPFRLDDIDSDHVGGSDAADGLERLCHLVTQGQILLPCESFTRGGSFLTGDTGRPVQVRTSGDERTIRLDLQVEGGFHSLALVPIRVHENANGLLRLMSRGADFFTFEDVEFYDSVSHVLGVALEHQRTQIELRERVKELSCLYNISRLVGQQDKCVADIITGIVNCLPPGWMYPEIAVARIVLEGRSYATRHFRECDYSLRADIVLKGEELGFVEVAYLENKPIVDEGPFLVEERHLINTIAGEIASFIERRKSEDERSQLRDQLRHADRLATIGQLAAGVAHELNEPLGNILGFAQLVEKNEDLVGESRRDIGKIISASLHAREIIKKLMVFSRQTQQKEVRTSLNRIVEEGLYFFEARCAKAGVELLLRLDEKIPDIMLDPGQINQVLVNLVVNALQAMPRGGILRVETGCIEDQVQLVVEDSGSGMTSEVREQIFIPFFTTKDISEGTGLGLPVVHGIVTTHRGTIHVDTRLGVGTKFTVRLPIR